MNVRWKKRERGNNFDFLVSTGRGSQRGLGPESAVRRNETRRCTWAAARRITKLQCENQGFLYNKEIVWLNAKDHLPTFHFALFPCVSRSCLTHAPGKRWIDGIGGSVISPRRSLLYRKAGRTQKNFACCARTGPCRHCVDEHHGSYTEGWLRLLWTQEHLWARKARSGNWWRSLYSRLTGHRHSIWYHTARRILWPEKLLADILATPHFYF